MFQLQFIKGDGAGGAAQSMTRFLAWSTMVGDTNAWGGATYCSYDLWNEFSNYDDETLDAKAMVDTKRRHNSIAFYPIVLVASARFLWRVLSGVECRP